MGEDPRDREAGRGVGAAPVVVHVHDGFVARDFGAGAVLRPRECYAVPTRYPLRVLNVVRFSRTLDFLCLALNATLRSTTDRYLLFPPSVASRRVASQANRLADSTLLTTQLMEIFNSVLFADDKEGVFVRAAIRRDIEAVNERDPRVRELRPRAALPQGVPRPRGAPHSAHAVEPRPKVAGSDAAGEDIHGVRARPAPRGEAGEGHPDRSRHRGGDRRDRGRGRQRVDPAGRYVGRHREGGGRPASEGARFDSIFDTACFSPRRPLSFSNETTSTSSNN